MWRRPPLGAMAGIQNASSATLPKAMCIHRKSLNISAMRGLLCNPSFNSSNRFVAPFDACSQHANAVAEREKYVKHRGGKRVGIAGIVPGPTALDDFKRGQIARKLVAQVCKKSTRFRQGRRLFQRETLSRVGHRGV